jgi:hypothetical protein
MGRLRVCASLQRQLAATVGGQPARLQQPLHLADTLQVARRKHQACVGQRRSHAQVGIHHQLLLVGRARAAHHQHGRAFRQRQGLPPLICGAV